MWCLFPKILQDTMFNSFPKSMQVDAACCSVRANVNYTEWKEADVLSLTRKGEDHLSCVPRFECVKINP
ncbi:hypothetical protein RHMOL_Rhmol13G0011800 [Rhododendron molle]|uniref:Uncharacterized protein n=1 Tax=Rhododendron molle TaxID=49168 RepID=A0ACC0L1T0_RHOML|nr:hypothetical protein RHMOL_Rhmol13G0011800 [Rhododendron molle]